LLPDDRPVRILAGLAVLLFVSRGLLVRGRGRYGWAKWAEWGSIAAFAAALCCALLMMVLWALGASP
jgi:hypothetical protein